MKDRIWMVVGIVLVFLAGCSGAVSGREGAVGQPAANMPAQPQAQPGPATLPASPTVVRADLPDLGAAPELTNEVWLNSDEPLRLADLRGQVVLVDMWTLGCINCQHVIPSLRDWYNQYAGQGLVIIGNHYPEFTYEASLDALKEAVKRFEIAYPVAQDNRGNTWRAFDTHYWPTLYLIDKGGHIRYQHIGEGAYAETEAAIQALLAESYPQPMEK